MPTPMPAVLTRPTSAAALAMAAALAVTAFAGGTPAAAGPAAGSHTRPLFSPASVWNARLGRHALLDRRSARLAAALAGEVRKEISGHSGPWINTDRYSTPAYVAGPEAPRVHVTLDGSDARLQAELSSVPIPAAARPAAGSDGSLAVYQPSTDTLWELWVARRAADGWHARWGGRMTNVSANPGYFAAPYGATGTGLPLVAGLIGIDELGRGEIHHALAIAVPNTAARSFTWPAQRGDGRDAGPDAIPEGTRFRIDPSVDLSTLHLSPAGLAIARAAQRYGMIVRDTSACVTFYAEDPVSAPKVYARLFGGAYPNAVLSGFPWQALQVVAPRAGG